MDGADVWPYDSTQWSDRDGDGYGDNSWKDLQLLMLVPLNGEIATSIVMVALIGMETVIPIMVMIYTEFQVNGLILMATDSAIINPKELTNPMIVWEYMD